MKLTVVKPKKAIKKLQKAGFVIDRQTGGHIILLHPTSTRRVTVAFHNKDLKRKTLYNILKQAGLSVQEFNRL
ncbi:MAG: type II toxin-antitoxin system HicA family toxin [Candidatus Jacksonbacteria bacterium]